MKNSLNSLVLSVLLLSGGSTFLASSAHAENVSVESVAFLGDEEGLVDMIDEVISSVKELEGYVTLNENQLYLRPIKVLGGKTKAMIIGRGSHSQRSIAMCNLLVKKIRTAAAFVESRYSVDATFDLAIQLDAITEQLDKAID